MKRLTMISFELAPHRCDGGLGIAVERLASQLRALGVNVEIIFPSSGDAIRIKEDQLSLTGIPFVYFPFANDIERALAIANFCLRVSNIIRENDSLLVVCHDNETALIPSLIKGSGKKCIFWLHSLYDTPKKTLLPLYASKEIQNNSILATGIINSDLLVTSSGIIQDALQFQWPKELNDLQTSILNKHTEGNVITVESGGCMPNYSEIFSPYSVATKYGLVPKKFILFPSRPTFSKGIAIFNEIAKRMNSCPIVFAATGIPTYEVKQKCSFLHWLPWMINIDLFKLMSEALAVVHPSLTEGYGLSAMESIIFADMTICHDVGGLRFLKGNNAASTIELTEPEKYTLYELWARVLNFPPEIYWNHWLCSKEMLNILLSKWVTIIDNAQTNHGISNKRVITCEKWGVALMRAANQIGY